MEKKTKNEKIRIAKLISNSGLTSRREAEKLIIEKRVTLYGEVIDSPALNVDRNAIVTVDGEVIDTRVKTSVWIFNKPKNCLVTKSATHAVPGAVAGLTFYPPGLLRDAPPSRGRERRAVARVPSAHRV